MSAIDRFDELTSIIRVILYLSKHSKSNVSTIIANSNAGQKAFYSAKKFLEDYQLLDTETKTTLPYNELYSLNERGKKIAEHLAEVEKILRVEKK
jgi:hypothetical protein